MPRPDGNGRWREPSLTLVTGASGFIGSAVVLKLLARGRAVRCLVEPGADLRNLDGLPVEIVTGDVTVREQVSRAVEGCQALFHLAAIYRIWTRSPGRIYEVNVEGTKTVLWAALRAGVERVVHTSSIAAVGFRADGQPADETTPFTAWDEANAYIRSKWLAEREALRFAAEGLPLVVVNPAFPFGERDIVPTPTGRLIQEALRLRFAAYPPGGFNCVDVEDVAEAHLLAERHGRIGERYILGAHNVTYAEFYATVCEVAGLRRRGLQVSAPAFRALGWVLERVADHVTHREPPVTCKTARYGTRRAWYDVSKARRELGMPATPLRVSLERAVRWCRDQATAAAAPDAARRRARFAQDARLSPPAATRLEP